MTKRPVPAALVEALAPSPAGAYERLAARAWEAAPADWRTIRDLRVLELWDNHYLTVFLGLDRRGRPGLHLTQTRLGADPDAGSTLARLRSVRAGPR